MQLVDLDQDGRLGLPYREFCLLDTAGFAL
jgi:hypothetical protein